MAAIAALSCFAPKAEAQRPRQAGIVAHRGFWNCEEAGYAKNSIAALRCAQEAGFWGSEFDVNMTSDGVLLVYHDRSIDGKKIENHPYEEFKNIRLKNGEPIPTIDQYLEQAKKHPETVLVYELKKHSAKETEDRLVDLSISSLKTHGLLDPAKVIFISFSLHMCERLAEQLPGFTVQYLGGELSPSKVRAKGINGIDYSYKILKLNTKWISKAKRLKMNTNTWTVNKEHDIRQMLEMEVDMITTDVPVLVRDIMKDMTVKEL
jgi:glycerophosphoryl diester phosphodiesterase